jgi:hypothetical protein
MRDPALPTIPINTHAVILACALASAELACAKAEPGGNETTFIDPSGDGDCEPGAEACECIDGGLCAAGLLCLSNTCVDLGDDGNDEGDDGVKPDMGSSGDGDGDGDEPGSCAGFCGGPGSNGTCFCDSGCGSLGDCCFDYETECPVPPGDCLYNSDCGSYDVCGKSGDCVEALWHTYDVYVHWEDATDKCFDEGIEGNCLADVYMDAYYGGNFVYSSPINQDTTSADFNFSQTMDPWSGMTLSFFDWDDFTDNDFIHAVCIGSDGECTAIPPSTLHKGYVDWEVTLAGASGYIYVSAYFSPH